MPTLHKCATRLYTIYTAREIEDALDMRGMWKKSVPTTVFSVCGMHLSPFFLSVSLIMRQQQSRMGTAMASLGNELMAIFPESSFSEAFIPSP